MATYLLGCSRDPDHYDMVMDVLDAGDRQASPYCGVSLAQMDPTRALIDLPRIARSSPKPYTRRNVLYGLGHLGEPGLQALRELYRERPSREGPFAAAEARPSDASLLAWLESDELDRRFALGILEHLLAGNEVLPESLRLRARAALASNPRGRLTRVKTWTDAQVGADTTRK